MPVVISINGWLEPKKGTNFPLEFDVSDSSSFLLQKNCRRDWEKEWNGARKYPFHHPSVELSKEKPFFLVQVNKYK